MLSARLAAHNWRASILTLLLLLLGVNAPAQAQKKKGGEMEKFEDEDPYTKGDRDLEKKLGYSKYGFLPWRGTEDSTSVQENMGGIPMLWVETEHFRIGSSLVTYKIPNDRGERDRIKEEISRLKKKLGRLKSPKKELDPYLRLHLYAQRAEDLYAAFTKDFGLSPAEFEKSGKHLGHKNKFLLLLCQRKSEFGRYLRTYEKQEIEYSYRTGWQREGMFSAANTEAISENWKMENDAPIDTMFHCLIAHCIANNFVDGYEQNLYRSPAWIVYGLGHMYTKRIDQRWSFFDGRKVIYDKDDESWYWEPRVKNLVKNDFYASAEKMFGWKKYDDLGPRDHMVAWSKLEYLVTEAEGDPKKFLSLACSPLTSSRGNEVNPDNELVTRQTNALAEAFGMSPEELDKAWAKWVSKTYKKK